MKIGKVGNPPLVDFIGLGGLAGLGNGLGDLVSADQVTGKFLYAKTTVTAYFGANKNKVFRSFAKGQLIGQVESYLMVNGVMWWMMYPESSGKPVYWVIHVPGAFDFQKLQQQGTKSLEQQKKEQEQKKLNDKSTVDKILDSASKTAENTANAFANTSKVLQYAVPLAVALGIGLVGYSLYNNADKITSKLTK